MHAAATPHRVAFRFAGDDRAATQKVTYCELRNRAAALGQQLLAITNPGERALIACPMGLDYIVALLACWRTGVVAVPAFPPHRNRHAERVAAIAADATPQVIIATGESADAVARQIAAGIYGSARLLLADEGDAVSHLDVPLPSSDQLALLQYTSGSTGTPKGVCITHSNLLANAHTIVEGFELDSQSQAVFWLPLYHDMGLVGGVAVPLLIGMTTTLLPPNRFLQQPLRWLKLISKYKANVAGGPNFAYDVCVAKTQPAERAQLDLSHWRAAFVGAEPIRAATLERFSRAFAPSGFNRRAFYPCYGMAEATLLVSGGDVNQPPRTLRRASDSRRLVSCGQPRGVDQLLIVDPVTHWPVPAGESGEIWIRGNAVAQGYWKRPVETQSTFAATLEGEHTPFLRTGDLGLINDGELFVTGRLKQVIIIRGVKYHPHDIEHTATSLPRLVGCPAVAFGVESPRGEDLVVAIEAPGRYVEDAEVLVRAARDAVARAHQVTPQAVVLVRPGQLARTSSGKIQRFACRNAYLAGDWQIVAQWRRSDRAVQPEPRDEIDSLHAVLAVLEQVAGFAADRVDRDTPLAAMNIDSLQVMELVGHLEKHFELRLTDEQIGRLITVGDIADLLDRPPTATAKHAAFSVEADDWHLTQSPELARLRQSFAMVEATGMPNPYFAVHDGVATDRTSMAGREYINFCSYNYLGLSGHPAVTAAAQAAIAQYGTSVSASRVVSGERPVHRQLEAALARLIGTDDAITFVGGHSTNETVIGHLFGPQDLILHDALAHNSIVQGCLLSGAQRRAFDHNDARACRDLLVRLGPHHRRVLVVVEGVYSMDGDICPLPEFVALRDEFRAHLMVDEAHSLGTIGATGAGIREHFDLVASDVDLWMGTLSKSLASCGGYIAASASIVEYLRYTAPGFVYSVGLPPANAAAALAAIEALRQSPQLVASLGRNAERFVARARGAGLDCGASHGTPIVPIITGSSLAALHLAHRMKVSGVNVQPILAPAVEELAARLRFFITAGHTAEQIDHTVDLLAHHSHDLPR